MNKKVLALLLAGIMTASLFAACSKTGGNDDSAGDAPSASESEGGGSDDNAVGMTKNADGKEEIRYWYPWGGDSETWDIWRLEEFAAQSDDYYVKYEYTPDDGGIKNGKLMAAIVAGDVPDVVCTPSVLSYPLATQGAFEDVTPYMEQVGRGKDAYADSVQDLMDIDGAWYILPMETDTVMLYINNKLAAEAGLDVNNPPKTISELDEWAERMTKEDGNGGYTTMGFIPWLDAGAGSGEGGDTLNYAWMFNADVCPDGKTLQLDTPEFVQIFEWMGKYGEKYDPTVIQSLTGSFGGAFTPTHPFYTEQVAMTLNGNWFQKPASDPENSGGDLEFTMAPLPVSDDHPELYGGSPLNVNTYVVPRGAKNPLGACELVDYIAAPHIADDNNKEWLSTPTRLDILPELSLAKEGDPRYTVVAGLVNSEHSNTPVMIPIRNQIGDEVVSLRDSVLYDKKDPKELLTDLNRRMQSELDALQ